MEKLPELVDALEDAAKTLQATARRLRKEKSATAIAAAEDIADADRTLLELHHKISHLLGAQEKGAAAAATPESEIGFDELTRLLYRAINPPESRRNYTYTPPFSIERVLRAYLAWINGPGKDVHIRSK